MPRIAVVIVGWNSWDVLPRCLSCLAAQTFTDFSVTVIDNASTTPIPAELQAAHPLVNVVRNTSNLGFAAANNLAVNQHTCQSEWVALLNPDAFPQPRWLAELMLASAA
ncbi:MAG: glycosyltransferase, partial [Candidatus Saccharibacteria bacterium]|nr:glycosyltransferase [Rhodoferax sp.]